MTRTLLKLSLAVVMLASGCVYDLEQYKVKKDFLKENATYKVISVGDADGNDTTVSTFFIRYKKPNDEREYWADWAYDTKDGKFELVGKGDEHVSSKKAQP